MRMTTPQKLWLGFGTLTALLVLLGVAILVRVGSIEGLVHEQANVARPRMAATRELEIKVVGYAVAVHEYLRSGDPNSKKEADEDAANVERYLDEYKQLATTDRQRKLATDFAAMWKSMYELGQTVMKAENRQPKQGDMTRFHDLRAGLENFLDNEMKVDALYTFNARRDATFRDVRGIVGFVLILLVGGVVVAVVTSGAVGRAVVRGERVIAEQRERLRTTLASIGDGVISIDTAGHITNMNAVAESLTGWTKDEAIGQPLDAVFRIVNEETRQTVENPVTRALKEGVIVGLANHTLLIGKDGKERPIDDSAAPIRCKEGELVGGVLVFRDVTERRRAESQLRRRELELADFFENATLGLHWVGPDGIILRANRTELELLGYAADEYIGHHIAEFHADEDVICDILRRLQTGEQLNDYEARLRCKDGSIRHVLINSNVMWEDGRFVHTRCFTRDITDRKQREESERRLVALVESSADAIISKSLDGIIQSWNAGAERLFGYTPEQVVGRHISFLIPADRINEEERIIASLRAGERVEHFDTVRLRSDGQPVCVSLTISPIKDAAGRVVGASKVARDITDRKSAEEQLRRGEELLAFLIDRSPSGFFIVDADFRIAHVNADSQVRAFRNVNPAIGRRLDEALRILWPEPFATEAIEKFRHTLETGEPYLAPSLTHRRSDIEAVESYEWQLQRVTMPDGRYAVVCYSYDTTQLREAEHALREADRRKNEFLAMLAHELRNPLAPIRNAAQVLRLSEGNGEAVASASAMLERQVGQMVRLVDDLLDVSRVSRGKIELKKGRIELASAVNHAVEAARPHCESMGHELTVTLPPQPIYLNADPTRLAQVVGNLLNNACKFTDKGGRLSLTVEREDKQAVIRVRDNGIGIAADQLPRIFEMFTQVDMSLERSRDGLGIGLTLVKSLVEMHDGTVEVHSAGVGQGCEFVVRLPILVEAPKPPPEPTVSTPTTTTSRRILVVDDNWDSATSLAMLLKLMKHETHTAYDGLEAVAAAETFRPDVVLLDIGLPKLNGYEACRLIREQRWSDGMVLVALTGWGQEEDRQRSKEAGFDAHLVKPVDLTALTKLLAELNVVKQ